MISPSPCQVHSKPARSSVCSRSRRRHYSRRASPPTATDAPLLRAKPHQSVHLRASPLRSPSSGSRVEVKVPPTPQVFGEAGILPTVRGKL